VRAARQSRISKHSEDIDSVSYLMTPELADSIESESTTELQIPIHRQIQYFGDLIESREEHERASDSIRVNIECVSNEIDVSDWQHKKDVEKGMSPRRKEL
jgi:hypothetical protein